MKRLLIALAALAAIGLGAVVIGGAGTSAQEGEDGGLVGTFIGKLADKLGVSEDELKTAIKDTRIEMIDEAVDSGKLTQEQADKLKERIEEGDLGFGFGSRFGEGRFRHGLCQRAVGGVLDASAGVLDMSVDDLKAQLKDGKSLAAVAEAQGMSVDGFKAALSDAVKAKLDQAVEEEKLTQEQADRLFQGFEENIYRIVNATPGEYGPCHHGHHRPFDGAEEPPAERTGA